MLNNSVLCFVLSISLFNFQLPTVHSNPVDEEFVQLSVRSSVREENGYFEYLPITGLWGRVLYHLFTDEKTFGPLIEDLDARLKNAIGTKELLEIEDDVVLNFPAMSAVRKLHQLSTRIWDVASPTTGRTFGEAIEALYNLSLDKDAVVEFVDRLGMPRKIDDIRRKTNTDAKLIDPRVGSRQALKMINEVLQVHPEVFVSILRDRNAMRMISRKLVTTMKKRLNVQKILAGMQALANVAYEAQPDRFDSTLNSLLSLRDPVSGMTVREVVRVLKNTLKSNDNVRTIADIFRNEQQLGYLGLNINEQKIEKALTRVKGSLYHPKKKNLLRTVTEETVQSPMIIADRTADETLNTDDEMADELTTGGIVDDETNYSEDESSQYIAMK